MRPVVLTFYLLMPSALAAAEPASQRASSETPQAFRLGGAAARAAVGPDIALPPLNETSQRPRLVLPRALEEQTDVLTMGPATLFVGEGQSDGRNTLELGTYLSRGATRAGVSITLLEQEDEVTRSEVFFDYSVTDHFSVGISGILNEDEPSETVPQIGFSAEYATEGGAFLQGGVSSAPAYDPVFGLSVGFRF